MIKKFKFWDKVNNQMCLNKGLDFVNEEFWGDEIPLQYLNFEDMDGEELYEGDIVNICFTSSSGEYIHDGVYIAKMKPLSGVVFEFNKLWWIDSAHNQYPISNSLSSQYGGLMSIYERGRQWLCVPDKYYPNFEPGNSYPFNEEKMLSFHSRYFKKLGNIYQNPELLEGEEG